MTGKRSKAGVEKEPISRVVTLGEVDNESACKVIGLIYEINDEDLEKEKDRKPIKLIINSPGGDVYEGIGIIDAIKNSKTPIHVYVYGQAQSMALAIAASGHYRFGSRRSTFMYHEISWETSREKLKYHEQEVKEGKRLWKVYDDVLIESTNITPEFLKKIRKEQGECYMTAQEALEYNIIDEIL